MQRRRFDHPLALLFWSQMGMAYALPIALEIASLWRGHPWRAAGVVAAVWPVAMATVGALVLTLDFGAVYAWSVTRSRRAFGLGSGLLYALFVFLALALSQAGPRNARMAWADYLAAGQVSGILALLVATALEVMAGALVACQIVAMLRRLRRLTRARPATN